MTYLKRLTNFNTFLKKNFIPPTPILGRWGLNHNHYIKTDLANHDCCGDKLCGNPLLTKEYISKNLVEYYTIKYSKEFKIYK